MSPEIRSPSRRTLLALAAGGLIAPAWPALAAETASAWGRSSRSAIRLLAGGAEAAHVTAGVEIALAAGYKTYWRSPGDSGIPPRFDWSGSENLAGAQVLWPVPTRFADGAGFSIGYAADVILPVLLTPADPARPIRLKLHVDYAVCEKICIPAQGDVSLTIPPRPASPHAARIAQFRARVPAARAVGMRHPGPTLGAAGWSADSTASGQLTLALECGAEGPFEVFVEGPEMWAFGVPSEVQSADGRRHVTIPVEDRPKGAAGSQRFTITLAGQAIASEWTLDLDIPAVRP